MKLRALTKREKVLLTLLALFLVCFGYFKLVHEPVHNGILDAQERQSAAETELLVEAAKLSKMQKLEAELEALEKEIGYVLPQYDNMQHVMIQLNAILGASAEYSLTFGELQFGDAGLVSRPVQMTFSANDYSTAREIINNLYNCSFRCSIGDINVSSGEKNISEGTVKVTLNAVFYELYE